MTFYLIARVAKPLFLIFGVGGCGSSILFASDFLSEISAEHMMGRELRFFSQIYQAVDPSIPVMDLNPKQMPADYQPAHADWKGTEEAMQMERIEAFTRRFAYLLDGMNTDEKAKGSSFWTPKALLKQMEKHDSEHTANVVKKKSLVDWPDK